MVQLNQQSFLKKQCACLVLVIGSDILFYGQSIGWTMGFYTLLLLSVLLTFNRGILKSSASKVIAVGALTLAIDLMESPGLLTISMFWLGLISLIILQKRRETPSAMLWLNDIGRFVSQSYWQWLKDYKAIQGRKKSAVQQPSIFVTLLYLLR